VDGAAVSQGKKGKRHHQRLRILTDWYKDLCKKLNNNRELIITEIDRLTNEEIINELKSFSADDEKYLWAGGAVRWLMENGKVVWGFQKTQGGKPNKI
jgi:hypothetical protein